MARDRLTDTKIRQAKPAPKPYKLFDGMGMYLLVHPNGSRYWRLKYRHGGKEKVYAIGVYPEVSLAEARQNVLEARCVIRDGGDAVSERRNRALKSAQDSETFQSVAEEWIASRANIWSPSYVEAVGSALAANLYPLIGSQRVRSIDVPRMRETLLLMDRRGSLAALSKVRMWASQVFRYAIGTGRADSDPAAPLRGTFRAHKSRNFAALTKPQEFGELIARTRVYDGAITRSALLIMAYTFVRTGELRGAEWCEFDIEKAEWRIPSERMKMGDEHIVPLSRQVIHLLSELKLITGNSRLVFPNDRNPHKSMSENTLIYALYRLGYHRRATVHGFRSSASTMLNELGFKEDVIERQLAHRPRNKIRAAYNKAEYLPDRRTMMQEWADHIDSLAKNSIVALG